MNYYRLILIISIFLSGLTSYSQITHADSVLDDILNDDGYISSIESTKKTFHFMYIRSGFDNATYYAGREVGDKQVNISQQLSYFSSNGFSLGVSGAWYSQTTPRYGTTVLNAGYGKSFGKQKSFRFSTSYNHYFYNTKDIDYTPTYHSAVNATISFRKKRIGTRLNLNTLLGQELGFSLSYGLYSRLTLIKFGKYNKLRFEPELNIYFSEESVLHESIEFLETDNSLVYDYSYSDKFGLMNTQFRLPLTLIVGNFDFETGVVINLPRSLDPGISYNASSAYYVSIGYLFSLTKF